ARHVEFRLGVVVILEGDACGQRAMAARERAEALAGIGVVARRGEEPNRRLVELPLKRAAVRDDELLAILAVLEIVVKPLALHPSGDEVEIALLVLAHVLLDRILRGKLQNVRIRGEPIVVEDDLDDVGDRLVRKYAAMVSKRESPEL